MACNNSLKKNFVNLNYNDSSDETSPPKSDEDEKDLIETVELVVTDYSAAFSLDRSTVVLKKSEIKRSGVEVEPLDTPNIGIFQNYRPCKVEENMMVTTEPNEQSSCDSVEKATDETDIEKDTVNWSVKFDGFKTFDQTEHGGIGVKIVVQLDPNYDDSASIFRAMDQKVMVFGFDLFRGSISNFKKTVKDLNSAYSSISSLNNKIVSSSLFAVISPRRAFTGFLKGRHQSFHLEKSDEVVITADRRYASKCTKKVIYVKATEAMRKLTNCSIIIFGDVRLQVLKLINLSAICRVAYPGIVTSLMPVRMPNVSNIADLSVEEIDDLKFISENDIQIIVAPKPGCPGYLGTIRQALVTYKCNTKRLFTRVILETLTDCSRAIWIAKHYDGFFVQVFEINDREEKFIALKPAARCFLDNCYFLRKPIIFQDFLGSDCPNFNSVLVNTTDQGYFYYVPDKYLVPSKRMNFIEFDQFVKFLKISDAERENFAISILSTNFRDTSTTGSDTFAFSTIRAAYEVNAVAIIVDTVSGMMPVKLSHFKPYCRIIAVTENKRLNRYLNIFHNVYVVTHNENNYICDDESSNSNESCGEKCTKNVKIINKFRTAINFCEEKKFIYNDCFILYLFRSKKNLGYTNKIISIQYRPDQLDNIVTKFF